MDKISASITSKGQITLPKTIRDLMNLNTSDQIHFNIEPDGRVFIEKDNRGTESLHNLVATLLKSFKVSSVTGGAGAGKTSFVKKILKANFSDDKIGVMDPYHTLFPLITGDLSAFPLTSGLSSVKSIVERELKLIVLEEGTRHIDLGLIHQLTENGIKVIVIRQELTEHDISLIGDHISVTVNALDPGSINLIEEVKVESNQWSKVPLYNN